MKLEVYDLDENLKLKELKEKVEICEKCGKDITFLGRAVIKGKKYCYPCYSKLINENKI